MPAVSFENVEVAVTSPYDLHLVLDQDCDVALGRIFSVQEKTSLPFVSQLALAA